jgi:hypothetical protein
MKPRIISQARVSWREGTGMRPPLPNQRNPSIDGREADEWRGRQILFCPSSSTTCTDGGDESGETRPAFAHEEVQHEDAQVVEDVDQDLGKKSVMFQMNDTIKVVGCRRCRSRSRKEKCNVSNERYNKSGSTFRPIL